MSRPVATVESWGHGPACIPADIAQPAWIPERISTPGGGSSLAYGQGRSYGDSCFNAGGHILKTGSLRRFLEFDRTTGRLRCEAGLTLAELLPIIVRSGWFFPVTPGTKYVSVGGAIANDVHGKNHHRAGSFGCHVVQLSLLRSDGTRWSCSRAENQDLFAATIGGLGLTGLIVEAEIQLKKIAGPRLSTQSVPFRQVTELLAALADADQTEEYTVAWLDGMSGQGKLQQGFLFTGNHEPSASTTSDLHPHKPRLTIPFDCPEWTMNPWIGRLFNSLYSWRSASAGSRSIHYEPFFYPLDALSHWNRLYGRRGLFQFQCVLPHQPREAILSFLREVAAMPQNSFLTVCKTFGNIPSPGLLSFPRPGVTLCFDFANRGELTLHQLRDMEQLVRDRQGALYPAKDAMMSRETFVASFPRLPEFNRWRDPGFCSDFWRRVS